MITLEQAKVALRAKFETGEASECPCCRQTVKRYARKITTVMAAQLVQLARAQTWVHCHTLQRPYEGGNRMYSMLRFWGLVEGKDGDLWRATERGHAFAEGRISIPSRAYVYNNTLMGLGGHPISIEECLGAKFSLSELMDPAQSRVA